MNYELSTSRHSLSHILAQAIKSIYPEVKLAIGPDIDNGFYYDFDFWEVKVEESSLKEIEKKMKNIIKQNQLFEEFKLPIDEWIKTIKNSWEIYKLEMAEDLKNSWETELTFYRNNTQQWIETFVDMCAWPHVGKTLDIDENSFKLDRIAWAYWKWDSDNKMLTRIYGLAFESREKLDEYIKMMEEARKRDHRIIWEKMKIFTISKLVWSWLPLLQPNWMVIRKEIEDYLWDLHKNKWHDRVWTPHLAKEDLYICSGHAEKFWDELFRVKWADENFFLKPMSCPHHMQIFADNQFSYRDMPIRYFEAATVYRDEKSWQLSWLTRVRSITQDDGHLFCRVGQISDEVWAIVSIIKEFYVTMWMIEWYWVRFSVRWPEWKYMWSDEVWEKAEDALKKAAEKYELPYKIWIDEAAFYWPKLDFLFKDAIWREWQLATIQCDFNLPERFDLSFVNELWEKERPVVIHRAISWSLERFMWVMIEHFAWVFPLWLAPKQVIIVPVWESFNEYGRSVYNKLKESWIRAAIDDCDDSLNKKVRNAEKMHINYILVVWEKESTSNSVAVRNYKTKEQSEENIDAFLNRIKEEIKNKTL